MELEKEFELLVKEAVKNISDTEIESSAIQFQKTKKEFEGDITLVVFPLTKFIRQNPEAIANSIGNHLKDRSDLVVSFNVVKGFLNLVIADKYWNEILSHAGNKDYGISKKSTGKKYMVEYASPNTNKPLHLGHLRNIFLGYSVSEILKANGHTVIKTQIINDRGIHICKSMLAWSQSGKNETPENSGIKGDHLVGKYYVEYDKKYKKEVEELVAGGMSKEDAEKKAPSMLAAQELLRKWENSDPETIALWKKMNGWVYKGFEVTYEKAGVDFDKLYYESDTYILGKEIVEEGLQKNVFFKKDDGSVWCDLTNDGLDEKIVLRSDGTSVYITQDIGTAVLRYKEFPGVNGMIYTVATEQDYHFKVLFLMLKKLGYAFADECYHLSYGMVDLPTGRMKTREGNVVDADDMMDEMVAEAKKITEELGKLDEVTQEKRNELFEILALGALKYFILKVDPKKKMIFDPSESIDFQGNTGPFVQYGYARIQSVLRKAGISDLTFSVHTELLKEEKETIKLINDYPSIIKEAGKNYSPAVIANYIYDLVKTFNHFYQSVPILKEENIDKLHLKLSICRSTANTVESGLRLMGIRVPERM